MAGAASGAISHATDQAIQECTFLCSVHDDVESLRQDWRLLQAFLSDQRGSGGDAAITVESVRLHQIRDAAYQAENIIDTADYRARRDSRSKGMIGAISRYTRKLNLVDRHKLGKDVIRCRRKIEGIKSSKEFLDFMNLGARTRAQSSTSTPPAPGLPTYYDDEAFVVGFEGDAEVIGNWLTDCLVNEELTVISIVAMPGAGKTTLARKVYNSDAVKRHFDAFAFVSISQEFQVLPVLKEIAKQAMGIKKRDKGFNKIGQANELNNIDMMKEQELAERLRGFLESIRYLIILDDVWKMSTWEVLQHAFPDSKNGSRVMLTTRNLEVANQIDNRLNHVHNVRLLNEEESWHLFSLKAFPSYKNINASTRQILESVGENLAKKCHGLPLALVILGSHLSNNPYFDTWSKMERCLDWEVTSRWDNMNQLIALSYDDMPSRTMKDCFLYIASFPEDFVIDTNVLTRIWTAEGFLQHKPNQILEDIAYDCLRELVQRSMVHVVHCGYIRERILAVQMHDVLRQWAIQKAWEEGFLKVCKNSDDVSAGKTAYRLSFQERFNNRISISAPNMRSMLAFHLPSVKLGTQRFIRVLHMVDTNLEKISKILGHLIHLRYVGLINCKNVVLPSSVGKLLNLQSIDLTGTCIPRIPKSLWDIPTLRHVEIQYVEEAFTPNTIRPKEQSELQTLRIGWKWEEDPEEEVQDEQLTFQHGQNGGVSTYEGPVISSPKGAFPRLRYLTLAGVQARNLKFEVGTMSNLIELTLFVMGRMTTVPDGLFDLQSLKMLVLYCSENALPRETSELLESKGIDLIIRVRH